MSIDGILNVNKPGGMTSFDVVAWLKRLTGEKHVGHAGTLDPIATGVLPICLGQGTRVAQFLTNGSKTYLAEVELGIATDTFDREGKITQRGDPGAITAAQIAKALAGFHGNIQQIPPVYSALKHHGKRYYELARAGVPVKMVPRQTQISSLELINFQTPLATIKVVCSKGTYIRSLANDLGQQLGCYANLKNLTRVSCGGLNIEDALALPQIEDAFQQDTWHELIYPIDSPLSRLEAVIVDKRDELALRNGQLLSLGAESLTSEEYCRAYSHDGYFIAILRFVADKNLWHPEKVFSPCSYPATECTKP